MSLEKAICGILAKYWLKENRYCGMPSTQIYERLPPRIRNKSSVDDVRLTLEEMRKDEKVSTNRTTDELWAYPKRKLLELYDTSKEEEVGIYTKQLRLGGFQYEHRFFGRQVLDRYKQDPRYELREWGFGGTLSIKDEAYFDKRVSRADRISIQLFGTGYTYDGEKVVAVSLIYLGYLSVEHQHYWSSFEIKKRCFLDSDYFKANFEGQWLDMLSIFSALTQEIQEINKICSLIGNPPLFNETFVDSPPPELSWLTKPTRKEYNSFIHALDKMLSENINRDFFKGKIDLNEETPLRNGKIRSVPKSSLKLLDEYLKRYWRPRDPGPTIEMIETFKTIRTARQKPAHKVIDDQYNPVYYERQRHVINKAYEGIRTLRLILTNHPKARSYAPPKLLQEGRIG